MAAAVVVTAIARARLGTKSFELRLSGVGLGFSVVGFRV